MTALVNERQTSPGRGVSSDLAVIDLGVHDDLAALRRHLDQVEEGRVALRLPWDLSFLSQSLDYDLLRREAQRRRLEVAVVSSDPERRQLAAGCGFAAFPTLKRASSVESWNGHVVQEVEPPPTYWWDEKVELSRAEVRAAPVWWGWMRDGVRYAAFFLAVVAVAGMAYVLGPTAEINLVPLTETVMVRVPVSVDPSVEVVTYLEEGGGILPSRRVGLEVEGRAEVNTTETTELESGRARGEVLFTSRLAQDYVVPAGTIVRTSSSSYPIRFRTTADVVVPANGQAEAPIEALDERTGNVGAYQINRVEGVAASAVRVINPSSTTGAEAREARVVAQVDYDRVREQLTQELLDEAYGDLHQLLEPNEFLPYASLRVEAVPKKTYSHFIGEEAESVGLNMRVLVSGQAVNTDQARTVAREALVDGLPSGYRLIESRFEVGDIADEEGPGWFTFYVTGEGFAAAEISEEAVISAVRGKRVPEARADLETALPLAQPPRIVTQPRWPSWLAFLDRVPLVPMRIDVSVEPDVSIAPDGSLRSQAETSLAMSRLAVFLLSVEA